MPVVVNVPNGFVAADTTPNYLGNFVDQNGNPIPAVDFTTCVLTILDTATGDTVNGCYQANILNTGRGTIDNEGNLTITLEVGDTDMGEVPAAASVQRSLVIQFTYNSGASAGAHRANITIRNLFVP